ncbi:MAG: hypothetical protein ABSA46_17880 [Thermodesulfovibrionales bacterium]|jgi:hypothetical protein
MGFLVQCYFTFVREIRNSVVSIHNNYLMTVHDVLAVKCVYDVVAVIR